MGAILLLSLTIISFFSYSTSLFSIFVIRWIISSPLAPIDTSMDNPIFNIFPMSSSSFCSQKFLLQVLMWSSWIELLREPPSSSNVLDLFLVMLFDCWLVSLIVDFLKDLFDLTNKIGPLQPTFALKSKTYLSLCIRFGCLHLESHNLPSSTHCCSKAYFCESLCLLLTFLGRSAKKHQTY